MPGDDDDNEQTVRELRRVRQESKERRLALDEVREQLEAATTARTKAEAALARVQGELQTSRTELEAIRTDLSGKLTAAEARAASEVAAAKAAADAQIASVRTEYEGQIIASEVKSAATAAGAHSADAFAKLVDMSKVTRDKDGKLVGVEDVIKTAKESNPWLFGDPKSTVKTGQQPPKPANPGEFKSAMDMKDDEFKNGLKSFGVELPTF